MPKSHTRNHRILPSKSVNARRAADHNRKLNVVDHNQFVIRSLKSVNTKTPQAKHSVNHTKKVWKATRNHNVNTTKTAWRPTGKVVGSVKPQWENQRDTFRVLRLPEELSSVHDTFHVSNLKKCLADANLHVPLDEIKVDKTLRFVEEPLEIMDREVKTLKRSKIPIVKVRWNSKRGPEFTWEREDHMKAKLFARLSEGIGIGFASVTTSRFVVPTGRVKVPAGSVVPTGKDSSIVSTGSTKVIPAGSTILVLVVLCLLRVVSKVN
ncbi:hypothetical protein Tco_0538218 [Tanacetum coccineum]